ncbi:glycine zipper 2TM domain-containing protein [Duganella violaceipulchra]|uniref:Glycine zipper 2TM domain-containing protein n=1 Tax=Duganella violaceipulchra TaxID=2849652 RepID=A0AA41L5V5_9BURK|nr:glycine zipper 2TM domain-containing protein [Duganella violaceicalia]MBV6319540.1 hypothetical protein [Duganella violaceicalia]MCP2006647.1 hypothetical protein [Duganella violaceicalia]
MTTNAGAPLAQQVAPAPIVREVVRYKTIVCGLVVSHVGGGNGRTLAAIAGAVGGGYVGNEIAKHNQPLSQQ